MADEDTSVDTSEDTVSDDTDDDDFVEDDIVPLHTDPDEVYSDTPAPPAPEPDPDQDGFNLLSLFDATLRSVRLPDDPTSITEQMRKAIELLLRSASLSEDDSLSISDIYEQWAADQSYSVGQILGYGVNGNGKSNLYAVLQNLTSSASETPDISVSLYRRLGS